MIAAAYAFDPEGFDGGEEYTPSNPLRHDTFIAQRPAGVFWLHVHPMHLIDEATWQLVGFARDREEGLLPGKGGIGDQSAWAMAAIDIVRRSWSRLRSAESKSSRGDG